MKLAAARALAELAHEPVPDSGRRGLRRQRASASAPTTSSPSRSTRACCGGCAPAVAKAAMESGVARADARHRRVPRAAAAPHGRHAAHDHAPHRAARRKSAPKRIVFPDGEQHQGAARLPQIVRRGHRAADPARVASTKIRQRADGAAICDLRAASRSSNPRRSPKHAAYAHEYLDAAPAQGRDRRQRAARCMNGATTSA